MCHISGNFNKGEKESKCDIKTTTVFKNERKKSQQKLSRCKKYTLRKKYRSAHFRGVFKAYKNFADFISDSTLRTEHEK